ncbi:MAG: OpgC domain-containing protein [Rhodobacteraceae bacterium]|nr:OpgC domain-containing protein [Paracoccaceae bacterium]
MPDRTQTAVRADSTSGNVVSIHATSPAAGPLPVRKARDRRIDFFRGLALVMIFINHVPGTIYETLTSRNFGFSDAAEGFVFLSGTSAALAYAGIMTGPKLWPGIARIWARAWTLYLVHLLVTVWVIGITAATFRWGGDTTLMLRDNVQYFFKDMAGVLTGLPLMTHQVGYVNILPMYAVLLLASPALILAGRAHPRLTLAGSVILWLLSGSLMLDLPNFPTPGGWFLNPLSWQLLFVLGLLTGLALRKGERLVPRHPALIGLSIGLLTLSLAWIKLPDFADRANAVMGKLATLGLPPVIRDFDKTYLSVPRLFHALALIYLLSALSAVRTLSNSRWVEPITLLGRQALPVFALGSILSFAARSGKLLAGDSFAFDTVLILAGILMMYGLAWAREKSRAITSAAASPALRVSA